MLNDLQTIGLKISKSDKSDCKLYHINNPNGEPRWIWNAQNPKPDFLRFYNVSSLRSKIFSISIKLIFLFKLQHFFFRKNTIKVDFDASHDLINFTKENFALFTGTAGPNRKLVLYSNGQFLKIALNETSISSLENELKNMKNIFNGAFIEIPQCNEISKGIVSFSDVKKKAKRNSHFTRFHAAALRELYGQKPSTTKVFYQSDIFPESIYLLEKNHGKMDSLIPINIIEKLYTLANKLAQKPLTFNWGHRDFTPWNCFMANKKIMIYDFEMSHPQLPFGFDAFHFVMQQGILVERLTWQQIKPLLKTAFQKLCEVSCKTNYSFDDYLKAYLFINATYHIDLYSRQEDWHTQIQWLLNTWNDAISDLLTEETEQRVLLIGDVFDFLKNENYAAIKFPNISPTSLSENADIDLLVSNKKAKDLHAYLQKHSLVKKIQLDVQSKMMSLMIVLQNDQLLALDLIWQLKVKDLDFMNVEQAIKEAVLNDFGIKVLNQKHSQKYLNFFYGLNGSEIPEKYHSYFDNNNLEKSDHLELINQVKNAKENKGFSGLINKINYLADVVRQFSFQKGMVITFSGVDGAGKSTIIKHTKKEFEKKFRKKVVVIRHRPSILPILSAITHGKEKAEQKAANTLPRQGNNKNVISSLLRFGYYFTDYFFGQFYIYAKHVLRGEIVLYDRYYFDFINDSLRSNIRLPKWFTKAGYKLLMKPNLNFFLYADEKIILERKKELDSKAINQLTNDYLDLFCELESNTNGKYIPIENVKLYDTMTLINLKIKSQII